MDLFSFYARAGLKPLELVAPTAAQVGEIVWLLLAKRGFLPPLTSPQVPLNPQSRQAKRGLLPVQMVAKLGLPQLLEQAFQAGQIRDRQGFCLAPEQFVLAGDVIQIYRPVLDAPGRTPNDFDPLAFPVPRLEVLYEDENLLAINKPAGLATTPKGSYVWRSVLIQARLQRENPELGVAHRLDRLTTGVLLMVKKPALRAAYQQLFDRRLIAKTYYAHTRLPRAQAADWNWQDEQEWCFLMRKVPGQRAVEAKVVPEEIRRARGWRKALKRHPLGKAGWHFTQTRAKAEIVGEVMHWTLRPLTGYTHQLRVTLKMRGLPILGDPIYGEADEVNSENLALHCAELGFTDPLRGHKITVKAPNRLI